MSSDDDDGFDPTTRYPFPFDPFEAFRTHFHGGSAYYGFHEDFVYADEDEEDDEDDVLDDDYY